MKRTMWLALLFASAGLAAVAQNTPDTAPVPEENAADPGTAAPLPEGELGADVAPPAAPLVDDPTLPGPNPVDPVDPDAPAVEPLNPAAPVAPAAERAVPAAEDPAAPDNSTPLPPAAEPATTPAEPGAAREPLPEPPTAPLDLNPANPADDPLREPIEREPLAPSVIPGEPIPPNGTPPAAGSLSPRTPDPAYDAPAPPQVQPQIEIRDVVRDPVRIYDARMLVLMGHQPGATKALKTLEHRFPTDARVQYLKFFLLSRVGDKDKALGALQKAVALERLYPMTDYNRFMEPLQGADRFYAERVRRAASELASVDGLVAPDPADYLPKEKNESQNR
jgi:hypothetical protein